MQESAGESRTTESDRADELQHHVEKLLRSAEALGPEQKSISLAWIGLTYAEQGRSVDAERALLTCVNLRELLWGQANQSNLDHARILTALGGVYIDLSQYDKAQQRLDEAGRIWRSSPEGSQDPEVATYLNNAGMLRYGRRQYAEAEPYMREAVALLQKSAADDDHRLAQVRAHLAAILSRLKLNDEADVLSAQAIDSFKHKLEQQPVVGSELLAVRLLVLRRARRRHEAKLVEALAREFQSRTRGRHVVDISALARSR